MRRVAFLVCVPAGGLTEEPIRGADGGMSREGEFAFNGEDIDSALFGVGYWVDEDCFGEVEFEG